MITDPQGSSVSDPAPDPTRAFFGAALMAVGALIAGLCGLCTVGFLLVSLFSPGGSGVAVLAIPIGGIPTGLGLLLFWGGKSLRKPRPQKEAPKPPPSAAPPG